MISKGFIKHSILYTVAGAMPMASAIVLLPFYVHALSASDFGALSIFLTFAMLVQIIVTYSFDASIYLYFHEYKNDPQKLSRFISSAFLLVLLIGLGVGLVLVWAGDWLFAEFFGSADLRFYPYGLMSVATAAFQAVFKIHNSLLQTQQRPGAYLWSNLIAFGLIASLTLLGLHYFPGTLMGPVGGRMLAIVAVGLWSLARIFSEFGIHFSWPALKATFGYSNSSYAYQLQQWVINYFDRPIMAGLGVMTDLGIYDFTLKCLIVVDLAINGLYNTLFPRILSGHADQATKGSSVEINRYYNGLTAAIMLMITFSVLTLPLLIDWFVTKTSFRAVVPFIPYAALTFMFKGLRYFFGMPYSTQKYSRPLPYILLLVTSAKLLLSYGLIIRYGIYGAIAATVACQLLEIVLLWGWIRKRFAFSFNALKLMAAPAALTVMMVLTEPRLEPDYVWVGHLGYVIFTVVLLFAVYRREWRQINWEKILPKF